MSQLLLVIQVVVVGIYLLEFGRHLSHLVLYGFQDS